MILHRVQVLCPNKYEDYKIGTYDILKYIGNVISIENHMRHRICILYIVLYCLQQ